MPNRVSESGIHPVRFQSCFGLGFTCCLHVPIFWNGNSYYVLVYQRYVYVTYFFNCMEAHK